MEQAAEAVAVLVLDAPTEGGRALLETAEAVGVKVAAVPDLTTLGEELRAGRAPVALVAYEALWPRPQDAIRKLREGVTGVRLVVAHSEPSPRLQLGRRLWAVNLIDYFVQRSLPPHALGPILRQAYADAIIELASRETDLGAVDDERAVALQFLHDLSRALNNQRRIEDLVRLVHRKLPYLVDYSVMQVLTVERDRRQLWVFPTFRTAHEAIWQLATATCAAVETFADEPFKAEDLQIIENAPFAADGEESGAGAAAGPEVPHTFPMVVHGMLAGCLSVLTPADRPLGREQKTMLQLIAGQLGAAMRNAQALREAEDASFIDELTGVHNRRFLKQLLPREWRRARRYKSPLAVAMLDIDHFKEVNDRYGHLTGDMVLRNFAALLRSYLRDTDSVVRFGGEEFLIVLPETGPSEAAVVMERIRLALRREPIVNSEEAGNLQITCSAGVAGFPVSAAATAEELIHFADQALLSAKRTGRDRVCVAGGESMQSVTDEDSEAGGGRERRRFPRVDAQLPVRYIELPDFEGQLTRTSSIDVSAGGIAIADPDRKLKARTYALVFVDEGPSPVLSQVVWTRDADDGRKAGLRFLHARQLHARVKDTEKLKAVPRALVIAERWPTRGMIERVLTAARYEMRTIVTEEEFAQEDLSRYALVVIGESSLSGWLGNRLQNLRAGLGAPGRLVVVTETRDRQEALRTIGSRRVEHLVPLDETADEALFTTLNKLLLGEYFGIRKYLLWGAAHPESWTLTRREEKSRVLEGVRRIAEEVHCHPRVCDLLIAAVEEMLINATVQTAGATREPTVSVECGTDGRLLAVSVLDDRGAFDQEDLYRGLGLALQRQQTGVPEGAKSASLGFRVMLSCLSQLAINVDPGRCTEVIGIVDLRKSLPDYRRAVPSLGVFAKNGAK